MATILTGAGMASAESADSNWASVTLAAWRVVGRHIDFSAGLPAATPMEELKIIATCGNIATELIGESTTFLSRISRKIEGMFLTGGHRVSLKARVSDIDCVGDIELTVAHKGRVVRGGAIRFLPSLEFSTVRDAAGKPTAVRYKKRSEVGSLDAISGVDDPSSQRGVPDGELSLGDNVDLYPTLRDGRLVLQHSQEMNGVLVYTVEEHLIR